MMRTGWKAGLLTVALTLTPLAGASAQAQDAVSGIRALYVKYLRREPNGPEINAWLQEIRRGGPRDWHASFLGTNEYVARFGGDQRAWINQVFLDVTGRPATPRELRHWLDELRDENNDTVRTARKLLRQYGVPALAELPGVVGPPPFPLPPPVTVSFGQQLVQSTSQLTQAVQAEVPVWQNRLALVQANNLLAQAQTAQVYFDSPNANPNQIWQVYRNVELAHEALRNTLAPIGLQTPGSIQSFNEVGQLLAEIRARLPGQPAPLPPPVIAGGIDPVLANRLDRRVLVVSANVRRLASIASDPRNPVTEPLRREIQNFQWSHETFRASLCPRTSLAEVQQGIFNLQSLAGRIALALQRGQGAGDIIRVWNDSAESLNELALTAGLASNDSLYVGFGGQLPPVIQPPIIVNPPPVVIQPPGVIVAPAGLLALLEQCLGSLDLYLSQLQPIVIQSPSYLRSQQEARALRNDLASLRTQLQVGRASGDWGRQFEALARRAEALERSSSAPPPGPRFPGRRPAQAPSLGGVSSRLRQAQGQASR
jgi:hypothetical protein